MALRSFRIGEHHVSLIVFASSFSAIVLIGALMLTSLLVPADAGDPAGPDINRTEIFRRTVSELNAGSGYVAHQYGDRIFILPLRTPVRPAAVTAIARVGDGWAPVSMQIALPRNAVFACAAGVRAYYTLQDQLLRADLDGTGTLVDLGPGFTMTADCHAIAAVDPSRAACDGTTAVFSVPLSRQGDWLIGCPAADGAGTAIRAIRPDSAAVDFGTIARGRGTPEQWFVRHLPWSSSYLVHVRYPGIEFFGVLDLKGWKIPFQALPDGPWFDVSRGFGAGRAFLKILRPADPLVIHASKGQLFLSRDARVSVLETPPQVHMSGDGCHVLIVTNERIDDRDADGYPLAKQTISKISVCNS